MVKRCARAISSAFALCAALTSAAGCEGCRKVAKEATTRPDGEAAKGAVTRELSGSGKSGLAPDIASLMCGVPASGILVEEITIEQSKLDLPGFGKATIKGTPIPAKGTENVDAGTAKIEAAKAVVCAGAVRFGMSGKVRDGGDQRTWEVFSLDLYEVTTEGVHWVRPPPKSGGHD